MNIQLVTGRNYKIKCLKLSSINGQKNPLSTKLRPSVIMAHIVLNAVK